MESKQEKTKRSKKKKEKLIKFVRFSESQLISRFLNDVPLSTDSPKPIRQYSSTRYAGSALTVQSVFDQCIEFALCPINPYPKKYNQQQIIKKIEKLFNLPSSDVILKLQPLASYKAIKLDLEGRIASLDQHQFYTLQSFEDSGKYELWKEQQRVRLRKSITKVEEKVDQTAVTDVADKAINNVEERLNHEFLIRMLVSESTADKEEEQKNLNKLKPFYERLEKYLDSVADNALLDMTAFIEKDVEASSVKRCLTPLNSFAYWLLDEYEERAGLGRLHRYTSLLHLLLTTKGYARERLALILWQMQLCVKEIRKSSCNKIEITDFTNIMEVSIKDTDHMMLNLFRYFGNDKLGAVLVTKTLVMLFEVSKLLKLEIFKTTNYQDVIVFTLEYSIRNLYHDLLVSCEEEKETLTKNPENITTDEDKLLEKEIESKMEDLTSIPTFPGTNKRLSERPLSPKQLSDMCQILPAAIERTAEYNKIFHTIEIDLQAECRRYFVKLLTEDIKKMVENRTMEVSCLNMLELCCTFNEFKKQFQSTVNELEEIGIEDTPVQTLFGMFKTYWAIESLESLKLTFARWLFKEKWEVPDKPIASVDQLFKLFNDYCQLVKRLAESKIFDDDDGIQKELRGMIGLGIKAYAEQIYNIFLGSFSPKIQDDLHQLLVPKAENLSKKSRRESNSLDDRIKSLRTASSPELQIEPPKSADVETTIRWHTPKVVPAKKTSKYWKTSRVTITGQMCAQINTISHLIDRATELDKQYVLAVDLSSVRTMLEQLEFSMLKMIAYCFNAFIPELVAQKKKYSEATLEIERYLQSQFSMLQLNAKCLATLREISLLLLETVGKVFDREMLVGLQVLYKDNISSSAAINVDMLKTWSVVNTINDGLSASTDSIIRPPKTEFKKKKITS